MTKEQLNDGAHGHSPDNRSEIPPEAEAFLDRFDEAISDDLNTPKALTVFDELAMQKDIWAGHRLMAMFRMDEVLGLDLNRLARSSLRVAPANATISETEIEKQLELRERARRDKNFAAADAIRDDLTAAGVEIMDGDELRWEWKIDVSNLHIGLNRKS
ncbi:MAG: hypothetical protein HKN78_02535 [Sphingomonadaceae bacterium]|nr:hypothetical protein [Sphingomonadaceae bacterium]